MTIVAPRCIELEMQQVLADLTAGVDLSALWFPQRGDAILGNVGAEIDPAAEWQGMPELEH